MMSNLRPIYTVGHIAETLSRVEVSRLFTRFFLPKMIAKAAQTSKISMVNTLYLFSSRVGSDPVRSSGMESCELSQNQLHAVQGEGCGQ
jgi:hypothetical protein